MINLQKMQDDDLIELFEEENNEPDLCLFCNGTGEGMTPDTTCQTCKGEGVKPQPKHNPYE
jgi:DnaJ-class molecular chaperone